MTDDSLRDDPFYAAGLESNDEFQSTDLGGAALAGRVGYHAYYDNDDPLGGTVVAMHKALDEALGMTWVDIEEAEREFGEATPETMARLLDREIGGVVGSKRYFAELFVEEFENALREQVEAGQDGDER